MPKKKLHLNSDYEGRYRVSADTDWSKWYPIPSNHENRVASMASKNPSQWQMRPIENAFIKPYPRISEQLIVLPARVSTRETVDSPWSRWVTVVDLKQLDAYLRRQAQQPRLFRVWNTGMQAVFMVSENGELVGEHDL